MRLHTNKKAIRALGVAESFRVGQKFSTLAGVVMRTDLVIDGFIFGRATVEGDDATEAVERIYARLRRNDINLIMLSGCIISLYNIVDVDRLSDETGIAVICLTYKDSKGLESSIRYHFGGKAAKKIEMYRRLGGRNSVLLKTGSKVYYRADGLKQAAVEKVLNMFTVQGSVPEPVRVAKLLARAEASKSTHTS